MKKQTQLIIGMGIIILLLLGFLIIPKITEGFKEKYRIEGYQICMEDVVNQIVSDLTNPNMGYTTLTIGNNTIKLGVVQ